ncbi:ABC transporter ATP-binding protein [Psychroflexus sp. ALD_RP9]|uniref:ABC transporter ATP-binding protein n=1 Tax=Psychroflexus sp. ALD_RP9 TaxID=2777186 RepID=UPI001A9032CC|nr:ABC transporter ATP-binding protein [Psychroflexus sp. ALD_RP9]QSS96172.1 ABC transporter ATP-binding protein [Psychroflexus sp. ALD_RP9]
MLKLNHISVFFENTPAFQNIHLTLNEGENLAVIGESGCGKSTLLKSIYGLIDLDKGNISWKGETVKGPKYNLIPGYQHFKFLDQEFNLMPYISVRENIAKHLSRQTPAESKEKILFFLKLLDLEHLKNKKVKNLSSGEKQRVALGRALAKKPELILLDEPFSHIDHFKKHKLRHALFSYFKRENISCIIATHDTEDVLGFSDKTLILKDAQQIDFRATKAIYNRPENMYCASLFGEVNTIKPKEFKLEDEFKTDELIIYPNEIIISNKASLIAEVTDCLFKGNHYKIYIKYKQCNLIIQHHSKVDAKTVNFNLDLNSIKKRLAN